MQLLNLTKFDVIQEVDGGISKENKVVVIISKQLYNKIQLMDIDEWSQDSQAFKTITSGSQTRNQTTNKKQYEKHNISCKPNPPFHFNRLSLSHLNKKLDLQLRKHRKQMAASRYKQLIVTNKNIEAIQHKIDQFHHQAELVASEEDQFIIYEQHEQEMRHFQSLWEEIFEKFRRKQEVTMLRLSVEEQKQSRELSIKIRREKERIERRYSKNKQLLQLSKLETDLVRKQKFTELVRLDIKHKKSDLLKSVRQSMKAEVLKIQNREMQKLRGKYDRKEEALKQKLKECREFEMKVYLKNQERLKQKFMNSVNKLQHEQIMKKRRCESAKK